MSLIKENQEASTFKTGETYFQGFPVCNHPLWGEFWDRYVNAYNSLVDKIEAAGIPIEMLKELDASVKDYERLSFNHVLDQIKSEATDDLKKWYLKICGDKNFILITIVQGQCDQIAYHPNDNALLIVVPELWRAEV